jgi:hypothetical protein
MKILLSLLLILITIFAGHSYVAPKSALDTVLNTYSHSLTRPVLTLQYGASLPLKHRGRLANMPKRYVSVKEMEPGMLYYSIQLDATKKNDPNWEQIRELQKKISHAMNIEDDDWKIALQGEVDAKAILSNGASLKKIDTYRDNNSMISSYKTNLLPTYRHLDFNLQIAEHRLSKTQKKRITIGYPTLIVEI